MNLLQVKPIGFVRSEHTRAESTPIQPVYAQECTGTVEILPEYEEGLTDIEGFSHIILLYWLHESGTPQMLVKPFLEDKKHGVFATRSPSRPNPIGLSIVTLTKKTGSTLYIKGVDILDQTPVFDIKQYSSIFDCVPNARNGWQDSIPEDEATKRGKRGYRDTRRKDTIS